MLSSVLEVEAGAFTGRARACFGYHKVRLAEAWAGAHGVDLARSYFYSDSYNDLPLLERVGTAVAVNPDARLLRLARRRGWPVHRWALAEGRAPKISGAGPPPAALRAGPAGPMFRPWTTRPSSSASPRAPPA